MKQKICLLLIVGCIATTILSAQKIVFGPRMNDPAENRTPDGIVGKYDDGFCIVNSKHSGLTLNFKPIIQKMDWSCRLLFSKEIVVYDSGSAKKEMVYNGVYGLKDNMICIMYNRGIDKVYGIKINKTGETGNKPYFIGRVADGVNKHMAFGQELANYGYNFKISTDSTALLAYWYKDNDANVHCIALDENMDRLWEKDLKVPLDGKDMEFGQCVFTKTGVIFMIDVKQIKKEKPTCGLLIYDQKTDSTSFEKLDLESSKRKVLPDPAFCSSVNKNGDVIFGAVCSRNENDNDSDGVYYAEINKNSSRISVKRVIPFPAEFNREYKTKRQNYGTIWIEMVKICLTDDKKIFFGMEERGADKLMSTNDAVFHYDDVVIGSISLTNNKMEWMKSIPKRQEYQSDQMMEAPMYSYSMEMTNNKIVLTYNDHVKNMNIGIDSLIKNEKLLTPANYIGFSPETWNMCLITMDYSGSSLKKYWLDNNDTGHFGYSPSYIHYQANTNTFVLFRNEGPIGLTRRSLNYQYSVLTIE